MLPVRWGILLGSALTNALSKVIFNLSLYMDIRGVAKLKDWALSIIFAARPFGAVLAGIIIKKTKRFKKLLTVHMTMLATVYSMLALTSISKEACTKTVS